MLKRLLIPLDGSALAAKAIPYAKEMAKHFDAEMVLLQIIPEAAPPPTALDIAAKSVIPSSGKIAVQKVLEENKKKKQQAEQYLKPVAEEIKLEGIDVSFHVVFGDPGDSILDFSNKEGIDTIIMTTSGKGGVKRFMLGSVADKVIRKAGKPVTVIR